MEAKIEAAKQKVEAFLDQHPQACQTRYLKDLERKTGVSRVYWALAGCAAAGLLLYITLGALFVSSAVGFAFPSYATLRALQNPAHPERLHWLSYWLVFGTLLTAETVLLPESICGSFIYAVVRTVFLAWSYSPRSQGADAVVNIARALGGGNSGAVSARGGGGGSSRGSVSGGAASSASAQEGAAAAAGVLMVKVISASGLPQVDASSGKTDPFCLLRLGPAGGRVRSNEPVENTWSKTNTKYNTLEPKWNEHVVLRPVSRMDSALEVEVRHRQVVGGGDSAVVGRIEPISLQELPRDGSDTEMDRPLRRANEDGGGPAGTLRLLLKLQLHS